MQSLNKAITSLAFIAIVVSEGSAAVGADPWRFEVTPCFLAAGLEGAAGVRGIESGLDAPFSDIADSLPGKSTNEIANQSASA